ncbi:MAG: hypothetical protein HY225_01150 [Candidatus Vogelbacteria bacterium]|nr:hypothetical protein [Candidatus Vogelbacteria bacterium]
MDFNEAIEILNGLLKEKQPLTFSSSWILHQAPHVYRYVCKNLRTENGQVDWDSITAALDRRFLKHWVRYKRKRIKLYESQTEVEAILTKYKEKLYILIAPRDNLDNKIRSRIIVNLVRISQRGNILAQKELIKWLQYVIDDWIDRYYPLFKWKGYTDDIEDKIRNCIRCYKYTGSFLGYLYKTLEYSARGIRPLQAWSLDNLIGENGATKIDFVMQDVETGEVKLFGR